MRRRVERTIFTVADSGVHATEDVLLAQAEGFQTGCLAENSVARCRGAAGAQTIAASAIPQPTAVSCRFWLIMVPLSQSHHHLRMCISIVFDFCFNNI